MFATSTVLMIQRSELTSGSLQAILGRSSLSCVLIFKYIPLAETRGRTWKISTMFWSVGS